jgi:hypothetical protein
MKTMQERCRGFSREILVALLDKAVADNETLRSVLVELSEIVEAVRNGEGDFDAFTLQPARAAIAAADEPIFAATRNVALEQIQPLTGTKEEQGKSKGPGGKSCGAPGKSPPADSDAALRRSLAAYLRWHAPSRVELERAPAGCRPLLDLMSRASGAQAVARLADAIEGGCR